MRAVFLGTPEEAVPTLRGLCDRGVTVPLVVTQPDRRRGRRGTPEPPAVKRFADEGGLEVIQPERVRTRSFNERLEAAAPDVLVVVAYGRILGQRTLSLAPHGAINVHFSLLPAFRGAAPVQWALARGERTTGVSTMQLEARLDAGPVYLTRELPIEPGEHAPELKARLARVGAELLVETLGRMEAGAIEPQAQDDSLATYAPLLSPADGLYRRSLTAREIEGRVRGFDPWPGVWAEHRSRRLRLCRVSAREGVLDEKPGSLLLTDGSLLLVGADRRAVAIERVQVAGRRETSARDAVSGRQLVPGTLLGELDGTERPVAK